MFGNSIQVNVDDHDCIYVLDWDRRHIKKYDPDGAFLCLIGKKGQGPGEFGNIWTHCFDQEGNIYATDIVNHRVSFFDLNGDYVKQIKIPESIGAVYLLSSGNYFTTKTIQSEETGARAYVHIHGIYDPEFELVVELHF